MVHLIPASPAHVGRIANTMRAEDRREVGAFGRSPKDALRFGLRASVIALTAVADGRPFAMLGITPTSAIDGLGCPWMLGTDEIGRHGRALIGLGASILPEMHSYFPILENLVSVENRQAIRLLSRWGFIVGGEVREIGGVEFVPFRKEKRFV